MQSSLTAPNFPLFLAARPKTWIAAISPVLIGSSLSPSFSWPLFFITIAFSLSLQIGANFANDYSDFFRGADTASRKGPPRALQSGWISERAMKKAIYIAFSSSLLLSIPLVLRISPLHFLSVGLAIVAAITYTGGPKPYGYRGLGELISFFFFGPVAAIGAFLVQSPELNLLPILTSLAPGAFSLALLTANNLRDMEEDRAVQKNTLVVRFGAKFGAILYSIAIYAPALLTLLLPLPKLSLLYLPFTPQALQSAFGRDKRPLLPKTALLFSLYTLPFLYEIIPL